MKKIYLYSDGSSLGNPGNGGWACILRYDNYEKTLSGGEEYTTNNKMELKAVIEGIKALKEPCEIFIFSDSTYVVNAINKWLVSWIKKNFKNVKNIELWKEYIQISKSHKINANWVKSHNGHIFNERCDELARKEAMKYKKA